LREQIRSGTRAELIADISAISPPPPVRVAPTVVTVASTGPRIVIEAPAPRSGSVGPAESAVVTAGLPSVDAILDKYLDASGGKSAFEKIVNRRSIGTVEITALGMTGNAELNEEAPGKSSLIIVAPGLGTIQRTFDGSRAWLQDPLQGFIRFTGAGLEIARAGAIFNKQTKLKELYPAAFLIGKEKLGERDTYTVRMAFEKWYFDVETGLLLRKGNTYYDDYREVDGVKLPFKMREEVFSGVGLSYQLTEIKHNVKIDETKFTAHPSCFTKP
jgi:hypothetical protein